MDWTIHHKATTISTNADARDGMPGEVYVADFQSAGRGRLDHKWIAPPGVNLMFSVVLDVAGHAPDEISTLPLVAGLAVVNSLKPLMADAHARLSLKWPNDVLADGRKLAGILCERVNDRVVAGIGLNVNQRSFASELADRATSMSAVCGHDFDKDSVLAAVLAELGRQHAAWHERGFAAMHSSFAEFDHLAGRIVSVMQTDSDPEPVSGLCGGIQNDGTLLVGSTRIYAGEAHVSAGCFSRPSPT